MNCINLIVVRIDYHKIDTSNNFVNKLYKFLKSKLDAKFLLEQLRWFRKVCPSPPLPRMFHTTIAVGNFLYTFGGLGNAHVFNDLHVCNIGIIAF